MKFNSILINYTGMRPGVQEAVIRTNELLQTESFYQEIALHRGFDLADIPASEIAALMRNAGLIMEVDLYYAVNPLKNIDGYDDKENPNMIHLNLWRLERPVPSLCNSMIHSCVHALNARFNGCYFGHGDNSLWGKEHTAPYRIGAIAQQLLSGNKIPVIPMEHDIILPGNKVVKDHLKEFE